jgi:hypothetical protein
VHPDVADASLDHELLDLGAELERLVAPPMNSAPSDPHGIHQRR